MPHPLLGFVPQPKLHFSFTAILTADAHGLTQMKTKNIGVYLQFPISFSLQF
jgi:hypothetical protein